MLSFFFVVELKKKDTDALNGFQPKTNTKKNCF